MKYLNEFVMRKRVFIVTLTSLILDRMSICFFLDLTRVGTEIESQTCQIVHVLVFFIFLVLFIFNIFTPLVFLVEILL